MPVQPANDWSSEEWVQALRGTRGMTIQSAGYQQLGLHLRQKVIGYLYKTEFGNQLSQTMLIEIAHEIAQDTLLKLHEQQIYDQYAGRAGASFLTYMTSIAINRAIDLIRRESKFEWLSLSEESPDDHDEAQLTLPPLQDLPHMDPAVAQRLQDLWDEVRRCIDTLSEQRRLVFVWLVDHQRRSQEIAEHLHKTVNAVHGLFHQAKVAIKQYLEEKGWQIDEIGRLYAMVNNSQ
jgi:RNA polymerase sigma factor (sigma-70 family)